MVGCQPGLWLQRPPLSVPPLLLLAARPSGPHLRAALLSPLLQRPLCAALRRVGLLGLRLRRTWQPLPLLAPLPLHLPG